MWKVVCLAVIVAVNCFQASEPSSLSGSSGARDQSYEPDIDEVEYDEEFEPNDTAVMGGRLIGKWRSNGAAIEPKWRDGDSIPLVPFEEAASRQKGSVKQRENFNGELQSHLIYSNTPRSDFKLRDYIHRQNIPVKLNEETRYKDYAARNDSRRYRTRKLKPLEDEELKPVQRMSSYGYTGRQQHVQDTDKDVKVRVDIGNYKNPFQTYPEESELNDEEYQRPRPRKRRPPQNYEFSETETLHPVIVATKKWPDDSISLKKDRSTMPLTGNKNSELKSLLKMQQIEGLSLSEILQRRNLTLSDLLKGKSEIINALKSNETKDDDISHEKEGDYGFADLLPTLRTPATLNRPRWPTNPQERIREFKRNHVETTTAKVNLSTETNSVIDKVTIQPSSTAVNNEGKLNEEELSTIVRSPKPIIHPRVTSFMGKLSAITVVATTANINTSRESSTQYNNGKRVTIAQSIDDDEIMEFSDFSTKKLEQKNIVTPLPTTTTSSHVVTLTNQVPTITTQYNEADKDVGFTLSIEHILSPTTSTYSSFMTASADTSVDNKSNTLSDDVDFIIDDEMEYQNDEPTTENGELQLFNINSPKSTVEKNDELTIEAPLPLNHKYNVRNNKLYEEIVSEVEPETRAEIFELISTGSSAQRLEKLLKSRNMSIDELIALRQRGSSQVHLAQISKAKSKGVWSKSKSPPLTEVIDENKPKNNSLRFIAVDKQPVIINFSSRNDRGYKELKPDENIHLVDLLSTFDSLPFAVHSQPPVSTSTELSTSTEVSIVTRIESSTKTESRSKSPKIILDVRKEPDVPTVMMDVGLVEEIAQEIEEQESLPSTDQSYVVIPRQEKERKTLSKVRPSIIASGAILGMTIVGFLAIFIVCRIRQKQKYMYNNTFSKAVFHAPGMTARKLSNSSSLNTIMVNVVATSTTKRAIKQETQEIDENFDCKSDIENDSLDANDSWETIPDFMK